MKKSFYLIYFFILFLFIFKQPILAEGSDVIKLSELEEGQRLEIHDKDVTLELDTNKTLSDMSLYNCSLTIKGTGTVTLDQYARFSIDGYRSQIVMEDGSIVNDNGGIISANIIMHGGKILAPRSGMFGNVTLNNGSIECTFIASDPDGGVLNINGGNLHVQSFGSSNSKVINISGGQIDCSSISGYELDISGGHIKCSNINCSTINMAENMTVLTPRTDDLSDGKISSGNGYGYRYGENGFVQIVPVSEVTPLEGISFDADSFTLALNEDVDLNLIFSPENASNKFVKWDSSDKSVVYVDINGRAYPRKSGSAIITATSEDGNYTATCEIKVERSCEIYHE